LLIDEMQEQKSDESAQSMACSKLIGSVDHVLAMTGTIIGGYADHLYPLMMGITPRSLREDGYEWGKDLEFSKVYGRIRTTVTNTEQDTSTSVSGRAKSMRRAKGGQRSVKQAVDPGVMPTMFAKHMMGNSIFITLEELAENLPNLYEYVGGPMPNPTAAMTEDEKDDLEAQEEGWHDTAIDMEPDQAAEYHRISAEMERVNRILVQRGKLSFLGTMLWTSMDYPDRPWGWGHDTEVLKAIGAAEEDCPALLGQAFLKNFTYQFDPKTETLTLTKDGETHSIKLIKRESGTYDIKVTFNGKHTKTLVYDTGASSIALPKSMANEIGLKPKKGDQQGQSQIADGSSVPVRITTCDEVKVGKFTIKNVECTVNDPAGQHHTVG
jgi:clan AA aspartic protease (TIGR02281 family)